MKKIIAGFLALSLGFIACKTKEETKTMTSSIKMPYVADYSTDFTNDVSDSSLLLVLNSYKYWETGDLTALRSTMGDSMEVHGADGFKFKGLADSIMIPWKRMRDSLSSISISMNVWLKNHSLKDSIDYINVWYKEIDTFKTGRVDSSYYEDDNGLKNGKIMWYSSHKQLIK